MESFPDTFQTRKQLFVSTCSVCNTVSLIVKIGLFVSALLTVNTNQNKVSESNNLP